MRRFKIVIHGEFDLETPNIWPDGDAPHTPHVGDVAATIAETTRNASHFVRDWNMEPLQVTVSGHGEACEVRW